MTTPSKPAGMSATDIGTPAPGPDSELLAEIQSAEADFERGDYIDLTPVQLARCIETGEFPWPDESSA